MNTTQRNQQRLDQMASNIAARLMSTNHSRTKIATDAISLAQELLDAMPEQSPAPAPAPQLSAVPKATSPKTKGDDWGIAKAFTTPSN